jgi:hypothetical protein
MLEFGNPQVAHEEEKEPEKPQPDLSLDLFA